MTDLALTLWITLGAVWFGAVLSMVLAP